MTKKFEQFLKELDEIKSNFGIEKVGHALDDLDDLCEKYDVYFDGYSEPFDILYLKKGYKDYDLAKNVKLREDRDVLYYVDEDDNYLIKKFTGKTLVKNIEGFQNMYGGK